MFYEKIYFFSHFPRLFFLTLTQERKCEETAHESFGLWIYQFDRALNSTITNISQYKIYTLRTKYIIYTWATKENIDIEIDVAYKWDVILPHWNRHHYHHITVQLLYSNALSFSFSHALFFSSLKHNSIIDRAVARFIMIVCVCVSDERFIATSTQKQ